MKTADPGKERKKEKEKKTASSLPSGLSGSLKKKQTKKLNTFYSRSGTEMPSTVLSCVQSSLTAAIKCVK